MTKGKSDYTPLPEVPPEVVPRLTAILSVLSGLKTVSQAAKELGLSRNRFQSLEHRAIGALVWALSAHPAGRPATPPALARLQAELERLQRENARLQSQVGSTERLLEVASGLLQGRIRASGRQARKRKPQGSRHEGGDDDPEAHRRALLAGAETMRQLKLHAALIARVAGVGAATLRRWRARARRGLPLVTGRHRAASVDPALALAAETRVRQLHGLIGAAALGHAIAGLTRRRAAALKTATLTALERERKAALVRVRITTPGIVRGFDAMEFREQPDRYALIAADGAVPYRTSVTVGPNYDAALVRRALEQDIDDHGAPLVYRLDRARCHEAGPVRALLAAHQVLVLHGPPRYPGYYGQLERQNREHRAWLKADVTDAGLALEPRLWAMIDRVNRAWPRRTLGWRTAAQAWHARPPLNIDRQLLCEEVNDRAHRIARNLELCGQPADLAERLAIEQTLTRMGYMRQEIGGWC